MREYLLNHVGLTLFLNTWLTLPLDIIVVHFMTTIPIPWYDCLKFVTPLVAFISVCTFFLGLMTDSINRDQLKKDFLAKLES